MSNTTPRKQQLRTRKLIDKSLQLRLVGAFISVGCVATLFQVVLLNNSMLGLSEELAKNGDILLSKTPGLLIRSVLVTLGLLVPALTFIGILVTHRIAGPAYRMRCYFQEIVASGEVTYPCKTRKYDELKSMCELVNKAVQRVQSDHGKGTLANANPAPDQAIDNAPSIASSDTSTASDVQNDQSA